MKLRLVVNALIALCLGDVISACNTCFRDDHALVDFRVIGVSAEPNIGAVGDTVRFTLDTADVQTRAVAVEWHYCPMQITAGTQGLPAYSMDGGTFPTAIECYRGPLLGTGLSVDLVVPAEAVDRGVLTVVGFACAGGTIGPPTGNDPTPTCQGNDARGWLFNRSLTVLQTTFDAGLPPNPRITAVRLGDDQHTDPIDNDNAPTVSHCQTTPCPQYRLEVEVDDGLQNFSLPTMTSTYAVDLAIFPNCQDYDALDAETVNFTEVDGGVVGHWYWTPPTQTGDAHFFIAVRNGGWLGFAFTERTVHVQ